MTSSTDRYEYSTLEVDTEAQTRNNYAETTQLPEVNHQATEHYNYPEVVGSYAPKKDGAVIDTTLPEPVYVPGAEAATGEKAVAAAGAERRICGIKRKIFFGIIAAAVVIIVGVVAGVAAGVVVGRRNSSSSNSSDGDGDAAGSTSDDTSLYANTKLATANFTDGLGNENYLVAYQLNNKAIYLSAWNSSNKQWVVSPIVDGTTNNLGLDSVRQGTSLALDVFAYSNSRRDIHIYWQLPDSGGLSTIKAMTYNGDKGISTQTALPAANWVDSAAGNSYISTAGSSLVSYGKQCDLCNQYTYLYWQTANGVRQASYQNASDGWTSDNDVIQNGLSGPSDNSSLAQAHVAAATTNGHRSMNVFYRATTSALAQMINGDGQFNGQYVGRDIGPNTAIAAFSTGFNETSTNWPEPLGFQVLTIDPATSDGVQLTYYKGDTWTLAKNKVASLADCKNRSTIVASHARRVYCLVGKGDNTRIVEYAWTGDPSDVSTYSNYDRIGEVVTTV
ncbi:uncharacterized protein F4822DRAFT_351170 [Hypoxylon trugodes]|uniref:uncharacterized protein n=1 Tax=Hypoxylon trugodes TaxID=326681 RepID=UPI0021946B28|nr:uncharacterized protein F4822DRAFT_351170 [Hypoxylon trugodes]KAI1385679.1 hypothetical protein F4822DRAFT_351170 [Hypoxylon trugodes]